MLALANANGLYCQNLGAPIGGEWMKIDHVFVRQNSYSSFPLIAVEHENGDFVGTNGQLPQGDDENARGEWAFWKSLSMRCHLSVLVAYPRSDQRADVLYTVTTMLQGWANEFNAVPGALILLGWWSDGGFHNPVEPYERFVVQWQTGQVRVVPVPWP